MKITLKRTLSIALTASALTGMASLGFAGECRVSEASMAKPGGFPERALTMVVPYGPGGGSGQVAAAMAFSRRFHVLQSFPFPPQFFGKRSISLEINDATVVMCFISCKQSLVSYR